MRYIKLFINILVLGIVFIFFAQNYDALQHQVQLQIAFFFTSPYLFPPIPLYMLLLCVFACAICIVLLIVGKEVFFLQIAKRKLERIVKEQEQELVQLRTLPLKEHAVPKINTDEVPSTDT